MTARFIDFDAARAERQHEPLVLQAYGKTFELPSEMPASLYLDVLRMEADQGTMGEVSGKDAIKLMRAVLPAAVLDELLEQPSFSLDDLMELTSMVMAAYQGEEAVPLAPNRQARRSQKKTSRPASSRAGSTLPTTPGEVAAHGPES